MSNYSQFFLNSSSAVVQFETIEISHPKFSKIYRIVRNAINGITATLEDLSSVTFDYYPLKITPTGSDNDLDQTLQVQFGDLGDILPKELDLVFGPFGPSVANPSFDEDTAIPPTGWALSGVPTLSYDASTGHTNSAIKIVKTGPGTAGIKQTIDANSAPGISYTVSAWCKSIGGGTGLLGLLFLDSSNTVITNVSQNTTNTVWTKLSIVAVAPAGTASVVLQLLGAAGTVTVEFDDVAAYLTSIVPIEKPVLIYRTYRSDDLTAPLFGPERFEIDNMAFQKEGATLQCTAPRLNLNQTGEVYAMDRFPMLRGFL